MLIYWLWLATRPDISDREKSMLLQHFQDAEDIYFAQDFEGFSENVCNSLQDKDLSEAEKILAVCAEKDIKLCALCDDVYPAKLKNVLLWKGKDMRRD